MAFGTSIFVYEPVPGDDRPIIEKACQGETVHWAGPGDCGESSPPAEFLDCEACFGNIPTHWIEATEKLRWLQLQSTGFDTYVDAATLIADKDIVVTNIRGVYEEQVAASALAYLLAHARGIDVLLRDQRDKHWDQSGIRSRLRSVRGSTTVLCGAGNIGSIIRKALEALGGRCLAYSRSAPSSEMHTLEELDAALPEADFVIACMPGTMETDNLFSKERFGRMKNSTYFINVGRGNCVDEEALGDALESGALAGAALDVAQNEPPAADDRLWTLPNLFLTQHSAGGYAEESGDRVRQFVENLNRYRRGEPLLNVVDVGRGY